MSSSIRHALSALCIFLCAAGLRAQVISPPVLSGIGGGGTVEVGQRVTLAVFFSGAGTDQTYQWRKNGSDIAGATASAFVISEAVAGDAGTYTVAVSNIAGTSVASTNITVKALAAPVIATQPQTRTAVVGQSTTFSFVATGSYPRTYQWQKDGVDIAGATQASYTIAGLVVGDAGVYSVIVTNSMGSAASAAASLNVNAATPLIITSSSPVDANVTQGQSVALNVSVSAGSSPFTYQWMKGGVAIAGATSSSLTFAAIAVADAGRYSVRVTNVVSSAVSREAVVTVSPAVIPSFNSQPQSQTVVVGSSVGFSVSVNGSFPFTYQWRKNGAPIGGATSSSYSINAVTLADAGDYALVVTNAAGAIVSTAAVLTVTPAVAPTITQQPAAQTIDFSSSFQLSVQAAGSSPLRYAWSKDGVPISSATSSSYFFSNATPAQSGVYTVTVTNAAGSVTSVDARITVRAALAPTITTQPKATEVAVGLPASLVVAVNSTSTGQLSFQWRRNDVPISGATGTTFYLSNAKAADAGDYTVVISGPGGTVTSAAVKLTVLPPAPPRSTYAMSAGVSYVTLGGNVSLGSYSYSLEGSPPFAYQWARNGVPISGATGSSYSLGNLQPEDLGDYTLTVSNDGGVLTFPPTHLAISPYANGSATTPWLDVAQLGDIVYFLAASPARIERYDLVGERWLTTALLGETRVPTAFAPTTEGVYIAYGRSLVRRGTDLVSETALINTAADVTHMFVFENFLYYGPGAPSGSVFAATYGTLHRSTLAAGPAAAIGRYSGGYRQVSIAPGLRKGFGRTTSVSPSDIEVFTIAADGSIAGSVDSRYHGTMLGANRTFVFPNEQFVTDDSGTVYQASTLTYTGSLGEPLTDLAFFSDGTPVILRGATVSAARTDNFQETGRTTLPTSGLRLFTRGTSAFVFGPSTTTGVPFAVNKVAAPALVPAAAPVAGSMPARYSVDDAFVGADRIVHVFSRTLQGLVRWSPVTREFLPPVPLRTAPAMVFHQPGNPRAIFAYADGSFSELPLGAAASKERTIGVVSHRVRAIVDMGGTVMLNLSDAGSSGDFRLVVGPAGDYRDMAEQSLYYGSGVAWQSGTRRLYSTPSFSGGMQYETMSATGAPLGAGGASGTNSSITTPVRFNADGTLLAGANGRVLNADLGQVGVLANNIIDAAWLGNGLFTIRSAAGATEVQQWARVTYLQSASVSVPGTPVRILRLSDTQLVLVTNVMGAPSFTVLNDNLSVATTPVPVVTFAEQPASQAPKLSGSASFFVTPQGTSGTVTYAWARNGEPISGATGSSFILNNIQPANAGLYSATASDAVNGATTDPAILGVFSTVKVVGSGSEVGPNIVHQNGRTYDQILLQGTAATVTADADQVLRTSFVDTTGDIVQVELSGSGMLSLVLENPTGPAGAANYNQPGVAYMKGHVGIVVIGADESTNLTVFSVGRMTAINAALFRSDVTYDGMADLAFIAITSANGKFGGLRAANASFFGTRGLTGLYAPNVQFTGPVFLGDVNAFDNATPVIVVGAAPDARITGGDLFQSNSKAVKVSGLTKLKFVEGTDSHGAIFSAQANKARLENHGTDVTSEVVVNPAP